jgi:hypothetical protein
MAKTPLIYTYIGNRTTVAISASFDTLSLIHKLSNNAHLASISSSLLGGADYVEADSISKTIQALQLLMVRKWWTRIELCKSAYYPLKPPFCMDLRLYLGRRLLMQRQITIIMHILQRL